MSRCTMQDNRAESRKPVANPYFNGVNDSASISNPPIILVVNRIINRDGAKRGKIREMLLIGKTFADEKA